RPLLGVVAAGVGPGPFRGPWPDGTARPVRVQPRERPRQRCGERVVRPCGCPTSAGGGVTALFCRIPRAGQHPWELRRRGRGSAVAGGHYLDTVGGVSHVRTVVRFIPGRRRPRPCLRPGALVLLPATMRPDPPRSGLGREPLHPARPSRPREG